MAWPHPARNRHLLRHHHQHSRLPAVPHAYWLHGPVSILVTCRDDAFVTRVARSIHDVHTDARLLHPAAPKGTIHRGTPDSGLRRGLLPGWAIRNSPSLGC